MNLSTYEHQDIKGRTSIVLILWMLISRLFIETFFPWPSAFKVFILRAFRARVGSNVVIKPKVKIKYPWKLSIGDNTWIGENVWLDNLDFVDIGSNCCISQGAFLLTGNHNFKSDSFDLMLGKISIQDNSWVGAKSIVCPSVIMRKGSILSVGSILAMDTQNNSVYQGNPAVFKRTRY